MKSGTRSKGPALLALGVLFLGLILGFLALLRPEPERPREPDHPVEEQTTLAVQAQAESGQRVPEALPAEAETQAEVPASAQPEPSAAERGKLKGRVLRQDGTALLGARVEVLSLAGPGNAPAILATCESLPGGHFECVVPDRTALLVRASADGLASAWRQPVFGGQEVTLTLPAPGRLEVRVLGPDGSALPGARVAVRSEVPNAWQAAGVSDQTGQALFEDLPGGFVTVTATREHLAEAAQRLRVEAGSSQAVQLVLTPGRRLFGVVRGAESGAALSGVEVSLHAGARTRTGDDGHYEFRGILPSKNAWAVLASLAGFEPTYQYVQLGAGEGDVQLDFRLAPAPALVGRVVDSGGLPVPGAEVLALGHQTSHPFTAEHPSVRLVTDARGEFRLDPVHRASRWTLSARGPWDTRAWINAGPFLEHSGGPVVDVGVLTLAPPAALEGRVEGAAESPLRDLAVDLIGLDGESFTVKAAGRHAPVDPWGGFRFDGLAAGRYRAELQGRLEGADEQVLAVSEFDLAGGEQQVLVLVLGRLLLSGRILDASGRPLEQPALRICAYDSEGRLAANGRQGERGVFELAVPTQGEYRLVVRDPSRRHMEEVLTGVLSGTSDLVVRLAPNAAVASIEGWLRRMDGAKLEPSVYLAFRDAQTLEPLGQVAIPDEQGAFRMERLAPTPYLVELVDFEGLYVTPRPQLVTPGGEPIEIMLEPRR